MITATREERTGRSLMDPADFADTVSKICGIYDTAEHDAETFLDQAIALVMTAAAASTARRENLWVSVPVDQAWQVWRSDPLLYSKLAVVAGVYVDRIPMIDPAEPGQLVRTSEVIQEHGFMIDRYAWHGRPGAGAVALVKSHLLSPAARNRRPEVLRPA